MPDPNKKKPRTRSLAQTDRSKTPKVRKNDKFCGSQGKYSREYLCRVQHNEMTNARKGVQKFETKADVNGTYVKRATVGSSARFPGTSQPYKGGFEGPGAKVSIAQNTR